MARLVECARCLPLSYQLEHMLACSRCGYRFSGGAKRCVVCGNKTIPAVAIDGTGQGALTVSLVPDTLDLPAVLPVDAEDRVVRPSLAVLFRIAIGPAADYYTPRFLQYERVGHGAPGWHWPAFLLQCVWAFYRKLWLPGIFYALLPVAGALTFLSIAPDIDDWSLPWWLCAILCVWLGPGIIAALLSTPLLYGRIRRAVSRAERTTADPAQAASMLSTHRATSLRGAVLLGGTTIALAFAPIASTVRSAYEEHAVREQIAESLSALSPLQREVEEHWSYFASMPLPLGDAAWVVRRWTKFLDDVSISPVNGRLRVALGPTVPELVGKTILLAPATDWLQRIHWTCIPVDIPTRYLPKECRAAATPSK